MPTATYTVPGSTSDAESRYNAGATNFSNTSTSVNCSSDTGNTGNNSRTGGFRWAGLAIPFASTISSALFGFIFTSAGGKQAVNAFDSTIYGDKVTNSGTFNNNTSVGEGSNGGPASRIGAGTTAFVPITTGQSSNTDATRYTKDITAIVQEIVNVDIGFGVTWVSGNALSIIVRPRAPTTVNAPAFVVAYDGSTSNCATLQVTWNNAPSAPGAWTLPTATTYTGTITPAHGTSTDADSDTLTYYNDFWNGSSWVGMSNGTSFSFNTASYADGSGYKFRTRAGDGTTFGSYTESPTFTIANLQTLSSAGAIATAFASGTAVVTPGTRTLSTAGAVASTEAFGTATIATTISLSNVGAIATAEAIGTAEIIQAFLLTASGIGSAEVVPSPALVLGSVTLLDAGGIASSEGVGSSTILPIIALSPTGIGSLEAMGAPAIVVGSVTLQPGAIASAESWGLPDVLPQALTLIASTIASQEALGDSTLHTSITVLPGGIATAELLGLPSLAMGAVTIVVSGIASTEMFGIPFVKPPQHDWSWTGQLDVVGRFRLAAQGQILLVNTAGDIILLTVGNPPGGLKLLD